MQKLCEECAAGRCVYCSGCLHRCQVLRAGETLAEYVERVMQDEQFPGFSEILLAD